MKLQKFRYWSRYSREYLYEPRKYASLASAVIVIVILALYFFGFKPILEEIGVKRDAITQRKQELQDINDYLGNIKSLKPILASSQVESKTLETLIPTNENMPDFLEHLSLLAATSGIQLDTLSPEKSKPLQSGLLHETKLKVIFKGDVQKALALVKTIEQDPRFIGIKTLGVSEQSTYDEGLVDMTLVIYYLTK